MNWFGRVWLLCFSVAVTHELHRLVREYDTPEVWAPYLVCLVVTLFLLGEALLSLFVYVWTWRRTRRVCRTLFEQGPVAVLNAFVSAPSEEWAANTQLLPSVYWNSSLEAAVWLADGGCVGVYRYDRFLEEWEEVAMEGLKLGSSGLRVPSISVV